MAKSLSKKLFGRKLTFFEWVVTSVSLIAGSMTVFQNLAPQTTLSITIQESVTKSPTNLWVLSLGLLLIITTIFLIKRKK